MATKNLVVDSTSYDPTDNLVVGQQPEMQTRRILLAASQGALARGQTLQMSPTEHTTGATPYDHETHVATVGAITTPLLAPIPVYILADDVADDASTQYVLVYETGTFNEQIVMDLIDETPTAAEAYFIRENLRFSGIHLRHLA